jgi:hypothetical protein
LNEVSTAFSIPELLYEEHSFGVFLLVTIVLGGGAALLTGRGHRNAQRNAERGDPVHLLFPSAEAGKLACRRYYVTPIFDASASGRWIH